MYVIVKEMHRYFDSLDKPEGLDMPIVPALGLGGGPSTTQTAGDNAPLDLERALAITAGYTLAAFSHRDLRPYLDLLLKQAGNTLLLLPAKTTAASCFISHDTTVRVCSNSAPLFLCVRVFGYILMYPNLLYCCSQA